MKKGRVTIPTNLDVVPQTLEILDEWGADAIRDCDGTEFPKELKDTGSKIYATYYTTRKDNEWAKAHPEEIQQMYIMTSFHTATEEKLEIHLMDHLYPDMLAVNTRDDIYRWWEVIDRTTGEPVSTELWSYEEETGNVVIRSAKLFHEYTVSFLAYIMWDPVHMYNAVVNDWKDVEPQITFDVRQPKTKAHSLERLRRFLDTHEYVDVVRFTTFFHQFTLIFDELADGQADDAAVDKHHGDCYHNQNCSTCIREFYTSIYSPAEERSGKVNGSTIETFGNVCRRIVCFGIYLIGGQCEVGRHVRYEVQTQYQSNKTDDESF